ncbi:redoxin domain-containing protein [Haladaptatus sp. DYSN1]|uniref:redoxin domain-containing protein n=1 Tax=unclassified Haladaptatus TaxID=2622732 RepID=UPI002406F206|nr:redoxin domain-containing protein [Haladaptatus sp. DYSN1]
MPPAPGDRAPDFTSLLCDGETFRPTSLADRLGPRGGVLVFSGFSGSAITHNWWTRYANAGWDNFEGVSVTGVTRDGPYAQNAFLRDLDSPFALFSDVDARAIEAFDLLTERDGMAGTQTARRAVFVLDAARVVEYRWLGDDWISPVPREEIEAAIAAR